MKQIIVSPSLLGGNPLNIEKEVEMINDSDADWLHIDIMDGVFVPNITIGFPVLQRLKSICKKPLDVHLMIVEPDKWINLLADAGAMMMNVHYEACTHLHRTIQQIHQAGMKAAVTLNPATPVGVLEDIICDVDMVLLMSVNPGFGGQKFIENTYKKISTCWIQRCGRRRAAALQSVRSRCSTVEIMRDCRRRNNWSNLSETMHKLCVRRNHHKGGHR